MMDQVRKVWIPEFWERENSFGQNEKKELFEDEEQTVEYIKTLVESEPEKALRFSDVGLNGELQMLIPTGVVNSGDLKLWAVCYEQEEDLSAEFSNEVSWETWGIEGRP
jgi:DNA-directed RNA polymerase subunit F